jgi:hypothetical protein
VWNVEGGGERMWKEMKVCGRRRQKDIEGGERMCEEEVKGCGRGTKACGKKRIYVPSIWEVLEYKSEVLLSETILLVVTPCYLVDRYQSFGSILYLHLQGMIVDAYLHDVIQEVRNVIFNS